MKTPQPTRAGFIALFAIAALALTSCGIAAPNKDKTTQSGASQQTIAVGTRVVAETLDPAQGSNANNDFYIAAMYDRIVGYDSSGKLVPSLATKWKYSDDAKTLSLTLRGDAKFHSGNQLTADDVVYTLKRLQTLGSGSAGYVTDLASITSTSPTEVTLSLKNPDLSFIGALSLVYVVDSQLVQKNAGPDNGQQWLSNNDAGSGPYSLNSYTANQQLRLNRFDAYWGGSQGRPSALVLRMITEPSAIRDELKAGNIDVAYGMPSVDVNSFNADDYNVVSLPTTRVTFGMMNMQGSVTSDVRVREAIQLAYDYEGHVKTALGGAGQPADALLPASMDCRVTDKPTQDIPKAKQLVKDAGAEGATLSIAYQPVIPEQKVAGTILEASLRAIGFKVDVRPVTFSQYLGMISKPDTTPDVAILWDFAPYPSPGPMLNHTWNSANIGTSNFARYSNPQVDKLLSNGIAATDPDAACTAFKDAQTQILKDRPAILMAYPAIVLVQDKKLQKIGYDPVSPTFDITQLKLAD